MFRNALAAMSLALALVACSGEPQDDASTASPADRARQAELLASYETARQSGNWGVAESAAEKFREEFPDANPPAGLKIVRERAEQERDDMRLEKLWDYQAVQASKGIQRSASIFSRTVIVEEGELAPTPDAQLVLRDHPDWGLSAYLLLAQKKFSCGSPCAVQIRLDDQPPRRFAAKQADSGKGPALFINDQVEFIRAMDSAELVRISLPENSGTLRSLSFEVAGYQSNQFRSAD